MWGIAYAVTIILFLGSAALSFSGCATVNPPEQPQVVSVKSQSPEVKTFFLAGNEANYRALLDNSPGNVDLSAYSQQIGVKYPRTVQVDILSKPPSRPYKSFAVLECKPGPHSRPGEVLAGLKHKAREIGADAIILYHGVPNQGQAGIPPATIQAEAIRYMLTGSSGK
jgi:hypothetical protein